ncbi:L,D-transpeptidase family protein [Aeromonas schubertii]|uniref:LysM domain-containing protein n=2 Tax=Aeromonas schubertii TaxID=652 RepID=A0A0S2SIJ3_9GAMM|nr:L,D-transpeptidase family protein [Aeromonas schubertii]ALP41524.1 LysM domain-containing protein [Aeromonas schubertii]KUE78820.1 L,D-transpeptidase [Aeromonas schubertii]MBZ6072530.1 L,D-transpeptidase family protein [Aeromonas schubertii]QCG46905.1 LysM peptidoglycan-binding domain-containing protein [Aeromonas schubertii]
MNPLRAIAATLLCGLAFSSLPALAVEYALPPAGSRLIGENLEYVVPNDGRALEAIAAEFQLGLTNLMEANPGVDPFLPKAGSKLVIPHQLLLPDTVREGIVINVAEMRLYYFPKGKKVVHVLPIGIGQLGADTPENWVTSVQRKRANPTWTPTENIRRRYAAQGKTLPAVWPAGPDNPMGLFALYIGKLYAIHGTNATFGIGLRVSSGCVRLRNEDIEYLFNTVPVGTRVEFVNRPVKFSVEPDGSRYLEVHQPLSRTEAEFNSDVVVPLPMTQALTRFIANGENDSKLVKQTLEQRSGMPTQLNP